MQGSHRRGVPRNQPKVSILVQRDQDRQDNRTEVITEPTAASRPGAFRRRSSPEESAKGFHSHATRQRPPGQHEGGHHRAHHNITSRGFSRAKTTLVRIGCTTCPLSNLVVMGSLLANIWEEEQGRYKEDLATTKEGGEEIRSLLIQPPHQIS